MLGLLYACLHLQCLRLCLRLCSLCLCLRLYLLHRGTCIRLPWYRLRNSRLLRPLLWSDTAWRCTAPSEVRHGGGRRLLRRKPSEAASLPTQRHLVCLGLDLSSLLLLLLNTLLHEVVLSLLHRLRVHLSCVGHGHSAHCSEWGVHARIIAGWHNLLTRFLRAECFGLLIRKLAHIEIWCWRLVSLILRRCHGLLRCLLRSSHPTRHGGIAGLLILLTLLALLTL